MQSYDSNLKVLLVEDDDGDFALVSNAFDEAQYGKFQLTRVCSLEEALNTLKSETFDVVLQDLGLPDAHGLEGVVRTSEVAPDLPLIVLTGLDDDLTAVQAIRQGVQDYVVKGQIGGNLLARSIFYAIERKKSEEAIKKALHQKNWLLKELHHRVKNNLQTIASLLSLQSENISDQETKKAYITSQNRIKAMLLLHELLYHSDHPDKVDFEKYLDNLTVNLYHAYGVDSNRISFSLKAANIFLNVETAIPCGMAASEIVSNSLKHAFPDNRAGKIEIESLQTEEDGKYILVIRDDGVGLSKSEHQKTPTLGLQLIESLISKELNGEIVCNTDRGTEYKLTFAEIGIEDESTTGINC